jgi:Mrp family chromosome partitioning ATPase
MASVKPHPRSDLRRAISRQAWLANRARNALHRPAFIGAVSIATFVTALVSMVVVPRDRPAPVVSAPRPDTLALLADVGAARLRLREADSTLVATRLQAVTAARQREADSLAVLQRMDSLGVNPVATRDSLNARVAQFDRALARAEQAPLPASYRALAELPELGGDPRVRALVDSLNEIERERDAFGAVGGVDPIFVALTSRVNDVGRAILAVAAQRRSMVATQLAALQQVSASMTAPPTVDTMGFLAARDSAVEAARAVEAELARRREVARAMDLEEERAIEKANAVAPPLALLAAAFVLSAVIGFGLAFFRELRRPRIANAQELERFLGVRVLSSVEPTPPNAERGRRQADRAAPPYLDPGAEGYQLAYLGLATDHPAVLTVTVLGDDPDIAAVVACNLAAVAADEARSTLVLDLDPRSSAAAALRARAVPGVAEVSRGTVQWADATISAPVGRHKSVDLVPRGEGSLTPAAIAAVITRDASRLARYYDAIVALATPEQVTAGLVQALPSPNLVYCAQPGLTPLRELRAELDQLRTAGAELRGIVLWSAERPLLPSARDTVEEIRRREPAMAGAR